MKTYKLVTTEVGNIELAMVCGDDALKEFEDRDGIYVVGTGVDGLGEVHAYAKVEYCLSEEDAKTKATYAINQVVDSCKRQLVTRKMLKHLLEE